MITIHILHWMNELFFVYLQLLYKVIQPMKSMQKWRKWSVISQVPQYGCQQKRSSELDLGQREKDKKQKRKRKNSTGKGEFNCAQYQVEISIFEGARNIEPTKYINGDLRSATKQIQSVITTLWRRILTPAFYKSCPLLPFSHHHYQPNSNNKKTRVITITI